MGGSFDSWPLIRADALDRAEEETGTSASEFYAFAARAGDRAYQELLNHRTWLFARAASPLMLRLYGPIAATLTWSAGYTATLGVASALNLTGFKVLVPGVHYGVRIVAHAPASTILLLESVFLTAAFADQAVIIYRDEYDLTALQDTPAAPILSPGGGGLVDAGTRLVAVSFGNEYGENQPGARATLTSFVGSTLIISAIPLGPPGTTYRTVYMTAANGTVLYSIAVLTDPLVTSLTYNEADLTRPITAGQQPPQFDGAGGVRQIITINPKGPSSGREIEGPVTVAWLKDHFADPPTPTWPPYKYARVNDVRLLFSHYPSQDGYAEIYYTIVARDLSQTLGVSEILVPRNWRYLLSDGMLFHLLEMKNDSRATTWERKWKEGLEKMSADEDQKLLSLSGNRYRTREEPAY